MRRYDLYLEVSTRYVGKKERLIGYALEHGNDIVYQFLRSDGTYNHSIIAAIAYALKSVGEGCELWIHCENRYVLDMISTNLDNWKRQGFVSAKGKPVKDAESWQRLAEGSEGKLLVCDACPSHGYSAWLKWEMSKKKVDNEK